MKMMKGRYKKMNPDISYSCYNGCHCYEVKKEKPTLSELQEQMIDINYEIAQVKELHISEPVRMCVLVELEEKKVGIIKAMHKCIDEMYS